jgi:hypothetical protein
VSDGCLNPMTHSSQNTWCNHSFRLIWRLNWQLQWKQSVLGNSVSFLQAINSKAITNAIKKYGNNLQHIVKFKETENHTSLCHTTFYFIHREMNEIEAYSFKSIFNPSFFLKNIAHHIIGLFWFG